AQPRRSVLRQPQGRLTLPAHPDPPRLPELDVLPQVMARAPALASSTDRPSDAAPFSPAPTSAVRAASIHTPTAPRSPSRSATAIESATAVAVLARESSGATSAIARLAAHQAQIGELHRAFLAQQTTVHERFLSLQ